MHSEQEVRESSTRRRLEEIREAEFDPLVPLTGRSAQLRSAETSLEVPADHGAPVKEKRSSAHRCVKGREPQHRTWLIASGRDEKHGGFRQ